MTHSLTDDTTRDVPLPVRFGQAGSVELEAANRAEAELLEDLDAEALAEAGIHPFSLAGWCLVISK